MLAHMLEVESLQGACLWIAYHADGTSRVNQQHATLLMVLCLVHNHAADCPFVNNLPQSY
jgi:hypothetical protein